MKKYSTLILDRDGVINKDFGYVCDWKRFEYIEGVIETLKYFSQNKYNIFIVTNQSGIARKLFSEDEFLSFQNSLIYDMQKKGVFINDFEYCPHHPKAIDKRYRMNCNCRKPNPGMIKKILKNYKIHPDEVIFVGDKISDTQAAFNSGIKNIYLIKDSGSDLLSSKIYGEKVILKLSQIKDLIK